MGAIFCSHQDSIFKLKVFCVSYIYIYELYLMAHIQILIRALSKCHFNGNFFGAVLILQQKDLSVFLQKKTQQLLDG